MEEALSQKLQSWAVISGASNCREVGSRQALTHWNNRKMAHISVPDCNYC